jgi:hypothetical protein
MTARGSWGVCVLSPGSHAPRAAAGTRAVARWLDWAAQHQILCLILFTSFVARLLIADWHSYWYDEILSVAVYGSNHATLAEALKSLASHSAHPPLYQAILYGWMKLFGTGEAATRTLSNLYITGATLCLYLLAFRLFGRRVAVAAALLFAFSYTATFYGLEVRSYAQSLFLVTLSSQLLWRWLDRSEGAPSWRQLFVGRAALLLCNIALLLTHYSNALFVSRRRCSSACCSLIARNRACGCSLSSSSPRSTPPSLPSRSPSGGRSRYLPRSASPRGWSMPCTDSPSIYPRPSSMSPWSDPASTCRGSSSWRSASVWRWC